MAYYVRPLQREDVAQVTEIDRKAFPTTWPPPNYLRELNNRLARYIVAGDSERTVPEPQVKEPPGNGFLRFLTWLRQLFGHDRFFGEDLPPSGREYIVGFAGVWIMVDEVHLTTIAVRESYLRRGIGELLLLGIIDLAIQLNARLITLEVRVSNTVAQSLYRKYGFNQVGIRKAYYTDNREDGLLLSTEDMRSPAFRERLEQLRQARAQKWGREAYQPGR